MRIVCHSCGAKYNVADEKVVGKVFKVTCKKCSVTMKVDGTAVGEGSEIVYSQGVDSDAGAENPNAIWYLVVSGEQTGPMTAEEVEGYVTSGVVDADSYIWRDGLDDWIPLVECEEFNGLLASPTPLPSYETEEPAGSQAEETQPESGGTDFFAGLAASAPAANEPEPIDEGIFGGVASGGADEPDIASSPSAGRGDDSVLFSLSDLAAGPKSKSSDVPLTEGSGLIDITALASAQAAVTSDRGAEAAAAASPAAESGAGPVVVPLSTRRRSSGSTIGLVLAALVIGALVAAIAVVMMSKGGGDDESAAESAANQAGSTGEQEQVDDQNTDTTDAGAADEQPANNAEQVDGAAPDAAAAEEADVAEQAALEGDGTAEGTDDGAAEVQVAAGADASQRDRERERERERERDRERAERDEARDAQQEPEPQREREPSNSRQEAAQQAPSQEQAPANTGSGDALAAALASVRNQEEEAAAPTPEVNAAPAELTRSQIRGTINRYRSRVNRCKQSDDDAGTYRVSFVIQPSGRVGSVRPDGGGSVGECVAGVVRGMSFPETSGAARPLTYPFVIR